MNTDDRPADDRPAVDRLAGSAPPAPAIADYVGYLLARAFKRARGCAEQAMPDGRMPRELGALSVLHERGPVSQRELGELLGVNRTIMVKLVDGMEAAGLVRRERDPGDRRSYRITPTAESAATLDRLRGAADRGEAVLVARLTRAEHERLNELLAGLLPPSADPPRSLTSSTGYLLAATHFHLRDRGTDAMRGLGIEPRDFGVLSAIAALEPCSQQQVAREMGVSGPAIVGSFDTLQAAGHIERERNPDDRREHVLRCTARGRDILARARAINDGIHDDLAGRLTRPGLDELRALLTKII
ncbi:MarR family transcriptional regulator [Spirillospora sp. NPDC047279]|uniref:MarR family winged helix-turn-helix transcriptional regulator n=1 Tax=Spirillospora sp. NPDC047279 TaxID=3155478 RepID=UPI0034024EF4